MKPGSDENIKLGDTILVVELDKIDLVGRWKDIPPSDTPGLVVPAYAPDKETRATAEALKTLQNQQLATIEARICQHPLVKQSISNAGD